MLKVVKKCLHCLEDYDGQGGSAFMCPKCVDATSLENAGNVTGRQLMKALRSIAKHYGDDQEPVHFLDVKA